MDAVVEIRSIGLKVAEYSARQAENNLLVPAQRLVRTDLQEPLV